MTEENPNPSHEEQHGRKPPAEKNKHWVSRLLWAGGVVAVFVLGYILMRLLVTPERPVTDFFNILETHGYQPNVGFSGNYAPGNIIQISEKGPDGKVRRLVPPVVVLWRDQCFPGKNLRDSLYVLPETSGESLTQLNLGAEIVSRIVPDLRLDSRMAVNYSLKLEDTRVQSFAKLELSQQFSETCVRVLEQDLRLGNKAEWYSVILEAVISNGISFTIDWQENTTAEARAEIRAEAEKTLAAMFKQQEKAGALPTGSVSLAGDSKKSTVLRANGQVIVGYRARQLQPIEAVKP